MGEMGVRRIGGKGGGGHEEHGTLDAGRVCTLEKELKNGGDNGEGRIENRR